MVSLRITSRVRNDNAVGYLLCFSQHSFECSILKHLVFKKTLGTAQCLTAQCLTTYQVVLGYSIQGLKESVGLKLSEHPFRG